MNLEGFLREGGREPEDWYSEVKAEFENEGILSMLNAAEKSGRIRIE